MSRVSEVYGRSSLTAVIQDVLAYLLSSSLFSWRPFLGLLLPCILLVLGPRAWLLMHSLSELQMYLFLSRAVVLDFWGSCRFFLSAP